MPIAIQKESTRQLLLCSCIAGILLGHMGVASAQVAETKRKFVRIGSLQSHFSAYGSERAWNNDYYEGLIWPADYPYQDNAVIKRTWIGAQDFTDAGGHNWDVYAIYMTIDYVGQSLFPMELKQTAKFEPPTVYVDGNNITAPYVGDVDDIDPDQIPDRVVTNVVNTSMGLTMTRRILAFSQQYHDNYFIKEFTFTNTGNTDWDEETELDAPLKGVRIGWGTRYSVCREGSFKIGDGQNYGKHVWATIRGEDYAAHATESITEANPIVQWLRCGFEWAGQSARNAFDNIGGPDVEGDGRLCAPQHAGSVVLHVDKSATDKNDDPYQPSFLGWHSGGIYPSVGEMQPSDQSLMLNVYEMLSGEPYMGSGAAERMDEIHEGIYSDPFAVPAVGKGGASVQMCYGPFDLEPGESITIVEAEGVNGINRLLCEEVGRRWKQAYDDASDSGPFTLPDGSTINGTDKENEYKNSWVYTGKDSILLTFGRAKRNFDMEYNIPQPPLPPALFEATSGGDRISLSWSASESEGESNFAGYKIYRAVGKPDTAYQKIYSCGPGVTSHDDITAARGFSYYYYIVSCTDGSKNTSGAANPTGALHSNRFYTRTTEPAYLRRPAGRSIDAIRVVPNPYHIGAKDLQYVGEQDKIMFLDIPGQCIVRIYTERGDLVETIVHEDGSGDEAWNSITSSRQVVVSGVYVAHFEVTADYYDSESGSLLYKKGDTAIRKFVIIR